ncbi:hypothetical protein O3P69_018842 [Scylla paramamosain]|uniref:Uncharacterized protein n=1 Tax=Scylla paramamosain TaxID=85552 RepID=A0AAW0ST27_SCYPA
MSKLIRLLAGTNNKYEYESETNISYSPFTNCRYRLDKTNCECQNYCDCSACNGGRVSSPHNKEKRIKAITAMEAGNSEKAFEFSKENLVLKPCDGMLSNANGRGCSIRKYSARIAALPMRINERNKEMDRSEHHPMVTMQVFKNKVAGLMTDIGELINSPLIAKALEHYKKSDTTINPGISSISASKESRMMKRKYAQYYLENKNVAFLMGINKKTFYSVVYNLNEFRFSGLNYKEVNIHQFISSINSAVVCGDYYSTFGDKSKDEQAAFIVMDDDDEEVEGKVIKKGKKRELDMFLSLSAKDFLLEEDYEIEEEMKEGRMKRKREDEEDETKELPVKSQRTSLDTIATTKVAASPDSRRDCNDDEFDFSA